VAELEATTVRKGNKKVSVTLSGWVVKSINWWDDGDLDHVIVGDKDYDLGTRFAITGSATISPGWSAGYNVTVLAPSTVFGFGANQLDDLGGTYGNISTLYSYIYIKSDTLGALNWGHLSPASDNPAVLADISGTVIESNGVMFEGAGFFLRTNSTQQDSPLPGLSALTWGQLLTCNGFGPGIGVDCWGNAQPAVRYDSPTWGGFRFEASYGKNQVTSILAPPTFTGIGTDLSNGSAFDSDTTDFDFADIAVFYTADWNSIKLSAAAAYTWIETAATSVVQKEDEDDPAELVVSGTGGEADLFQVGASVMHKPSGLGVYAMYQFEETGGRIFSESLENRFFGIPDTDAWYIKPFIRKGWSPIGATVLYGEYGEYHDQFGGLIGVDLEEQGGLSGQCAEVGGQFDDCFIVGSEVQRWGLGAVQEIDSAAMHLWVRWQHLEADVDLRGLIDGNDTTFRASQSFDDWDLFQAGGIIFF
jgi:hypothetical protein